MPHIDPRLDPRRAKMLDVARASVSGRRNPSYARRVQVVRQRRRAREKQQLAGLRDVRCSLTIDCNCAICDAVDRITGPAPNWDKFVYCGFICWHPVDGNRPGIRMAYAALCRFDGEFDPWYSWLKTNLPDTVAGRHLLDHIIGHLWGDRP